MSDKTDLTAATMLGWQPIETAPKDRPIVGWCVHEADDYFIDDEGRTLTTYGAHCEGLGYVTDGPHVLEWCGSYHGSDEGGDYYIPNWWFRLGSDMEEVANPTHWMPLPEAPVVVAGDLVPAGRPAIVAGGNGAAVRGW